MARYVKFLRGTPDAYKNLAVKDSDTLYFIYEEDETSAELYLGTKLIAGSSGDGTGSSGASLLSQLQDVLISEDISDSSFLVYDAANTKWVNKSIEDLLFVGATDMSSGLGGLVPAPAAGQTDLFLKSDGTWGAPEVNHIVLTLENTDGSAHGDIITDATESIDNVSGDIIIIKDLIADDKWQYTAYVFDDGEWHAMDGNYNAENIYFDKDLITTTAIGNIKLTDGQATIAAAGKNLKEVFETIFVKEENPKTTAPSVSITFAQGKAYEVGNTVTTSYSASFKPGSYTYGPATGVTVTSWEVTDSEGNSATTAAATLGDVLITDDLDYSITVLANHTAGAIPYTNLKNEYAAGQIAAGVAQKESAFMTGYRSGFYGTVTEKKEELTSADIRALTSSGAAMEAGQVVDVNILVGAYRVLFAYPASLPAVSSIVDVNGLYAQILSSFKETTVSVSGANDYEPIDYRVYYMDFADPYNESNVFTFTIGEEED